jgi:DNA invertase Pin-like site-specific DNA recombinase
LARPDDSQVIPITEPRLVGYARVSTDEQTTRLQLDALRAAGCVVIHEDAASGVSRSRPGLRRALADLAAGDSLFV